MNWLDVGLLVILGLSVISGIFKGLVREVFSLGGVILSVFVALAFAPQLQPVLDRWIPYPAAAYAAALLICFLGVMLAAEVLARLLNKLISFVQLGPANRLLGGFFGLVRGILIGTVLVLGLALFLDPGHPTLSKSKVTPYLTWGARTLSGLLPEDIRESLQTRLEELEKARDALKISIDQG